MRTINHLLVVLVDFEFFRFTRGNGPPTVTHKEQNHVWSWVMRGQGL